LGVFHLPLSSQQVPIIFGITMNGQDAIRQGRRSRSDLPLTSLPTRPI
jgi:hypothetical protein